MQRAPQDFIDKAAARARYTRTPCGKGNLIWRIWGNGSPLVLLHGAFGSWLHWIRNIEALARGSMVIVPDMPGYGDSYLPEIAHTPEDLAKLLVNGLDSIVRNSSALDVAGFSFGGIVAGHVAVMLEARLSNLVLLGPNGMSLPRAANRPLLRLESGMDDEAIASLHRHNLAQLMIADAEKVDDLAVHIQVENAKKSRFKSGMIPWSDSLLRALPSIRGRIGGIWGELDAMAYPHLKIREDTLRQFQPDLDFRIIPGAGHWVMYEAPQATTTAIATMIGRPTRGVSSAPSNRS